VKLLITADAVGGVWQYATDLARALRPLGVEPVLALLGPAPSDPQRAAAQDLELIETGLPLDWLAASDGEVRAAGETIATLAASQGADLVQLNAPALAIADYPVPVIAVAHSCLASWWEAVIGGELPDDFAWRTALHAEGLRRADLVVTPSAPLPKQRGKPTAWRCRESSITDGRSCGCRRSRVSALPLPPAGSGIGARMWPRLMRRRRCCHFRCAPPVADRAQRRCGRAAQCRGARYTGREWTCSPARRAAGIRFGRAV
jgi:hypothetical protein